MAPGRRRGAKGVRTKRELSLGDLVLAKVKGFPPWPAKISKPEDWKRVPDPKKYFVQFFGTLEIAFVAPVDVQEFTHEVKNKLSDRGKGKTGKAFDQAVKEICEEYKKLQPKSLSDVKDANSSRSLGSVNEAAEAAENDGMEIERSNFSVEITGSTDLASGLEHYSQKKCEVGQDVKDYSSDDMDHCLSPREDLVKGKKLSPAPANLVEGSESVSTARKKSILKNKGSDGIKVEDRPSVDGPNELPNGNKSKMAKGQTNKTKGAVQKNQGSTGEGTGKVLQRRVASGGSLKISSGDISKLDLDAGSERNRKKLVEEKRRSQIADDHKEGADKEENRAMLRKKMNAKGSKSVDAKGHSSRAAVRNVLDDKMAGTESERSTTISHRTVGVETNTHDSRDSINEDDLPPAKRHRQTLEATPSSNVISEGKSVSSTSRQSEIHDKARSQNLQLPKKRRAVRICDSEDDELPKTPIHGGLTSTVSVGISDSKAKTVRHVETYSRAQRVSKNSGPIDFGGRELLQSESNSHKALSSVIQHSIEKRSTEPSAAQVSLGPLQVDKLPLSDAKPVLVSPKGSPQSVGVTRTTGELKRQHSNRTLGNISLKKIVGADNKSGTTTGRPVSMVNQSRNEVDTPTSEEKSKSIPMSDVRVNSLNDHITSVGERMGAAKDARTSVAIVPQISDSVTSMKHLIAAAQARKKQARFQIPYGNPLLLISDADLTGRSPSPSLETLAIEPVNMFQLDVQGSHLTYPSADVQRNSSINQSESEDPENRRMSSGNQGTGSSLSGDTEAAVARDAFEGMIETLSRTKESIGRATRLAIDCAKYGIAKEVMELLIRKLENESSLHRKVDIFFLVDSITQCSHSQRGIAGASYIPIVKAVLPRLIGAAAPAGAGAQENRRQCLKVLRLWLERKILPESVLRNYMDDIGVVKDDASSGFALRRPSRAERAIDDPIREMEGIVVDEYGSNATFQLPGLLSGHVFKEEEEYEENLPADLCKEVEDTPPSKHSPSTTREENNIFTPSDRRHCILEDVDGELEMEDVSGNQKDEGSFCPNTSQLVSLNPNSDGVLGSTSSISTDAQSSPEGRPPLPSGTPPSTPPPPTSPPLSLSAPAPTPPPRQQNLFALPPTGPPQLLTTPPPPLSPSPPTPDPLPPTPDPLPPSQDPPPPPQDPPPPPQDPPPPPQDPPPPPQDPPPPPQDPPPPPQDPPSLPQALAPSPLSPPAPVAPPPPHLEPLLRPPFGPLPFCTQLSPVAPLPPPPAPSRLHVAPQLPPAAPPPVTPQPPHAVHPPQQVGPPTQLLPQQQFTVRPPMLSQHMHPVPSGISHSPQLAYQPPHLQHEMGVRPSGNQQIHDLSVRSEVPTQQSSSFPPHGMSTPREPVGYYAYGHGDAYTNPQATQHGQQFLPGGGSFAQGPVRPELRPQSAPGHFSYLNSAQQNQYPPFSSTNVSDGPMRYAADEKRWMQVNQFNADCQRIGWNPGGKPHTGYFGSTPERPPPNAVSFQHSGPNTVPSASQIPVRNGPMMHYRPDASSVNWRPG